jgi:predicted NACHT family NTPase
MSKQVYGWKRFWCPRSGSINLADGGYLYDPEGEWGKAYNPDLVIFETISHLPCLALLGEPGIGKTQALEVERSEIVSKIQEQGDQILFLDLRSYGSEDRLVRSLFDSPEFKAWQADTHQLHIFLDSFDECLLRIDTLATLLVDEFKRYRNVVHRLCLRIACRTAIWQPVLEEGLKEIWGENSVGVYELAPLRRIDVIEAAKAERCSPDDFLKEVNQKNIVPLAIKPITLRFLLNTYHRHGGQFPPNQKLHELYLEGCKLLCEEINESRRGSNLRGNLDIDQRLIVAARIAAITILANRFAVWTGIDQGNIPAEDGPLQKLCHGYENANGREFEITRAVIEEVLDTGLFSSRGLHRMGWAHQTYAEFLAAWYLVQHEMPLDQITGLIFSSEEPDCKLIPQLHETVAWIASMRVDVRQEIIETDPDVLLRSDIPTDSDLREAIVTSLLMKYEQEKLYDYERNQYRNYGKLKHPGLAAQLHPYIQDPTKQIDARDTAIEITEVCEVSELQEELVNLALDSSQSIYLRVSAAKALCSIGDAGTRLKLKPLAIEQLPEDEDDRLKGYALKAIWSDHLTATELFSSLTRPKKRKLIGSYHVFTEYELVQKLQPNDLVIALDWLVKQGIRYFGHPFEHLGNKILLRAWDYLDLPGVTEGFVKVALVQWKEHQKIITDDSKLEQQFEASLLHDSEKRRKLIKQAVLIISEIEVNPLPLLSSLARSIVIPEDIAWIIGCIKEADSEQEQKIWATLIRRIFRYPELMAEEAKVILEVSQINSILYNEFSYWTKTVDLDSAEAVRIYTAYLQEQAWQSYDQQHNPPVEPPPKERVLQCLDELELGDLSAWWRLNMEMTLKPDSTHYDNEFELDLTKLPGWQEAEEATQKKIIESAKNYIQNQDNVAYEWIGTNNYDRPALAGCRAFQLLLKESPDFLDNLSSEIWKKWAPVIIAAPSSNQHEDPYLEIVKCAYVNAPQESINTLIMLIDKENQEHDYIFVISRFDKCWDERLKLALLEKAKDSTLKPKCVGQLLEELLKQGLTEVRDFAKSLISLPLPLAENEREKVLTASRVLIENSDSSSWSFIWSLIQKDLSFGHEVLELTASRYSHGIQLNLTETQLADLYVWLVCQYPHDEDPDYSNEVLAHSVTARDGMAGLRDSVLVQLKERGTLQACTEVQRLIQELPSITWLTKTLIDAQVNMRRKTWQPPKPEDILQLVSSQLDNQNTHIQTEVLIMQGSNNPNLNFGGSVGAVNINSTVHGDQIGTQHNYASEQNLVEAFDEIQQIFDRLTQTYPASTESEQQIVVAEAVKEVKQNPALVKRVKVGGQAFIFEALQKASDQWWVSPFVKAIEAGIKGE